MATNRDLLKEAIADAKAVKETAIANAKAALEEAFTPFLKEKLSAKLAEMEDEDESMYEAEDKMDEVKMEAEAMEMEAGEEEEIDEEINIDELLAEMEGTDLSEEEATKVSSNENLDEYLSDVVLSPEEIIASLLGVTSVVAAAALGTPEVRKAIFSAIKSGNVAGAKAIAQNAVSKSKETKSEMEEQLNELRNELNEVNLLNAKLLYTNKIFRNKSLNETQKVKVLTAFDKATSKKEVELVYETLLESLKTTTKAPIKESMSSASKVLGGTTSKPIIENDAFARMRELAFGGKK